jgi:hypothetical protein
MSAMLLGLVMMAQPRTHADIPTVYNWNAFVYAVDDNLNGICSNIWETVDE